MNNKLMKKKDFINGISIVLLTISVIQFVYLLFIYVFHSFSLVSPITDEAGQFIRYVVAFYNDRNDGIIESFNFVYAIFGAIAGISQFDLINNKNRIISSLSVGIKRKDFAKNRILSGLLLLLISSFVPITISFILNIFANGISDLLLGAFGCQLINVIGLNIFGFMLGALGCLLCKNIFRAVLCSISISALPFCVLRAVEILSRMFLRGKADNIFFNNIYRYLPCFGGLIGGDIIRESALLFRDDEICLEYWLPALIVAVASVIMLVVIEKKLIYKLKPENSGIRDASRVPAAFIGTFIGFVVSEIIILALDMFSSDVILTEGNHYSNVTITVLVGGTVASLVTSFILCRKNKPIKILVNALPFPIIFIAVLVIMVTGAFGYTSRVPKVSEVDSVTLLVDAPEFVTKYGYGDSGFEFYSEDDIEKIIKINKAVAKTPKNAMNVSFSVIYHLKNGDSFERYFMIADESVIDDIYSVFDTDAVKEKYKNILFYEYRNNIGNLYDEITCTDENNTSAQLFIVRNDLSYTDIRKKLSNAEFTELKKAILDDYCNASSKQIAYPGEKPLCALVFSVNVKSPIVYDYYYDAEDDFSEIDSPRPERQRFYIYSFMEKTVGFLRSHNLYSLCKDVKTPVLAEYITHSTYYCDTGEYSIGQSEYWALSGANIGINDFTEYDVFTTILNEQINSDLTEWFEFEKCNENIKTVYENAYMVTANEKGGNLVVITFDDDSKCVYYVPELNK